MKSAGDSIRYHEEKIPWHAVRVGDLVLVKQDEQIPADLILVDTSSPDGFCYVDTVNLDGESNLKARRALTCTYSKTSMHEDKVSVAIEKL